MWRWIGMIGGLAAGAGWLRRRKPASDFDPLALIVDPRLIDSQVMHIDGVPNFRDIGGYATMDGGQVQRGRVYRSGSLHGLTDAGWAALQTLNVQVICDLRGHNEMTDSPDNLPEDAPQRTLKLSIEPENRPLQQLRLLLFARHRLPEIMMRGYVEVGLRDHSYVIKTIFEQVAQQENLPLLIHCTAGKDRTGLSAALLLKTAGVDDETVIADYTLSNLNYATYRRFAEDVARRLWFFGVQPDDLRPLLTSRAETMRAILDHISAEYGSIAGYLTDYARIAPETLDAVRRNLRDA